MSRTITEWVLKMVDGITAPMRAAASASDTTSRAADNVADSIEGVREAAEKLPSVATKIAAGAFAFNQVNDAIGRMQDQLDKVAGGQLRFETAMAKANTMAELEKDGLGKVTDQIRVMSGEMPILRTALADGFYQVVSNSVPEDNWISFLNDTAKASVGGVADLGQAVKVTSTIIKNYGLEWDQAGLIQDKIQKTAKLGVTSFAELGEALPRVAGSANTLGVNINELLGSYAALTGVSGNTAEVSTQLGAIFTSLIKPTAEAGQMASAMGIQFDAGAIKAAGGMQKYFSLLQSKVEAYSSQTGTLSTEIYGRLFGSAEALRAFIPLTGEIGDVWKEKTGQVVNAAGTIQQAFDTMAGTTESKTLMMQNGISNFTDRIVDAASGCLPFVSNVGDAVTGVGNFGFAVYGLSVILKKDLWTGLLAGAKGIASFIVKCGAGIVSSVSFALTSGAAFGTFKMAAVSACRTVGIAIMSIPIIGWIAAAIAAITALCVYLWDTSAAFRGFVTGMWEAIKAVFGGLGEFFSDVFGGIWHLIKGVFNPANWFADNYHFSDGLERIANAAAKYGEKVGQTFGEGKQKGIEGFERDKAEKETEEGAAGKTLGDSGGIPGQPAAGGGTKLGGSPVGIVTGNGGAATTTKPVTLSGSGGGGGGKSVTMNVTFNQHFAPGGDTTTIAEDVFRKITGLLRDATVQM